MTRDEAIGWLQRWLSALRGDGSPLEMAILKAIEALKQVKAIDGIIDVSNLTIQEDVLKYKMIVDIVKVK